MHICLFTDSLVPLNEIKYKINPDQKSLEVNLQK